MENYAGFASFLFLSLSMLSMIVPPMLHHPHLTTLVADSSALNFVLRYFQDFIAALLGPWLADARSPAPQRHRGK